MFFFFFSGCLVYEWGMELCHISSESIHDLRRRVGKTSKNREMRSEMRSEMWRAQDRRAVEDGA